uniref:NADH dehydrogenase subunit 6 n=1 Tax=Pentapycnon charcoti TaxID=373304 RepID=UPI00226C7920|nr:NADH dehydrogenase subunit 6 [Pentapycnon charcoti]UZA61219.1 NADH dehydrogenase subunit 6 [Pentapycnon charcoti]
MKIIIMMMTMNSMLFSMSKMPISMIIIIIMQTMLISLVMMMEQKMFWMSYILMLIFISGMLIAFIYIASITPQKKFKLMKKSNMMLMSLFMGLLLMMNYQINISNNNFKMKSSMMLNSTMEHLSKMMSQNMSMSIMFLMLFLLMTLLITVKISNMKKGPIRLK